MSLTFWDLIGIATTLIVTFSGWIFSYRLEVKKRDLSEQLEKYKSELNSQESIDKMFIEEEFKSIKKLCLMTNSLCNHIRNMLFKYQSDIFYRDDKVMNTDYSDISNLLAEIDTEMYSSFPFIPAKTYVQLVELLHQFRKQHSFFHNLKLKKDEYFVSMENSNKLIQLFSKRMLIFDEYASLRTKYNKKNEMSNNPEIQEYIHKYINSLKDEN